MENEGKEAGSNWEIDHPKLGFSWQLVASAKVRASGFLRVGAGEGVDRRHRAPGMEGSGI